MWKCLAALLLVVTPALAQENATAYESLRVVSAKFGRDSINRVISVIGVNGNPLCAMTMLETHHPLIAAPEKTLLPFAKRWPRPKGNS